MPAPGPDWTVLELLEILGQLGDTNHTASDPPEALLKTIYAYGLTDDDIAVEVAEQRDR